MTFYNVSPPIVWDSNFWATGYCLEYMNRGYNDLNIIVTDPNNIYNYALLNIPSPLTPTGISTNISIPSIPPQIQLLTFNSITLLDTNNVIHIVIDYNPTGNYYLGIDMSDITSITIQDLTTGYQFTDNWAGVNFMGAQPGPGPIYDTYNVFSLLPQHNYLCTLKLQYCVADDTPINYGLASFNFNTNMYSLNF